MNDICITRKLEFDYGHRLVGHESKCRNAHGHRGVVEISCKAPGGLDSIGRVIDFSVIKSEVGGWIDHNWDHAFIYEASDSIGMWLVAHDQKRYEFPKPPTAENLASYLLDVATNRLSPYGIVVTKVVFWETPNSCATCKPVGS